MVSMSYKRKLLNSLVAPYATFLANNWTCSPPLSLGQSGLVWVPSPNCNLLPQLEVRNGKRKAKFQLWNKCWCGQWRANHACIVGKMRWLVFWSQWHSRNLPTARGRDATLIVTTEARCASRVRVVEWWWSYGKRKFEIFLQCITNEEVLIHHYI